MKKTVIVLLFLFIAGISFSQNKDKYPVAVYKLMKAYP